MTSEEERALEGQLETQLKDQRDSLTAINDALTSDPGNSELLAVHGELVRAIKDAEEGLLHLKRARLLQEADSVLHGFSNDSEEAKVEPLDPADDVELEPLEEQRFYVGSKCRFRHNDGRWYNGRIISFDGSDSAKISFLTPTNENMLICKFFLQQRCRFGGSCRFSHGIDVPISSLKKYVQTEWDSSMVGSTLWAVIADKSDIWRKAELESWDEKHKLGHVIFCDDGSSATLGVDSMMLSEYGQVTESEESDLSSYESDSSGSEEEAQQGLGFVETTAQQRGIQKETIIFADWENHTRGVASKMMANMGYRQGMGLGASGQGQVDPISVKVLKPKQSLDHALESLGKEEEKAERQKKKRTRGGKRKREKKLAEAARAAREGEESRPDVFSLINSQLAMHHQAVNGGFTRKKQIKEEKKVDRRAVLAYEDEMKDLRSQITRLEEMVKRNRNEKTVYEAAMRKLTETQKALADAEAAHAAASSAVASREKEKKWLKF